MSIYVDIEKKLGTFQLDVKFEAENEIMALLGASGSGKSMTLKCIAGVEKPDKGKIVLDGKTIFDSKKKINLSPQQRKIGYLFQNYALFPNMTVEENVSVGIHAPKDKRNVIVQKLIQKFHLSGLEGHYPSQLSGGQQQRVALARILASEPNILLLDEPFSALDSYLRWQVEQELSEILNKFEGTTLLVSHNRDEVYRLCNRIAVLSNGKMEAIDEKHALFENPQTLAATLLTGCKNISKALKLSDFTLKALDWNTILTTEQKIQDNLQYVGVRAHCFLYSNNPNQYNTIKGKIVHVTEDLFSVIIMFECENSQNKASHIRWDLDKMSYQKVKETMDTLYLKIQPKDVLLIYN